MLDVVTLKDHSLRLMADAGYPITEKISIQVDPSLPFMGYTTEQDGHPLIVIAGWSLTSGGVEGLVIHELSHVYRIETKHPSHDSRLQNRVMKKVIGAHALTSFEQDILYNAINNLQDLYADDVSFAVYFNDQKRDLSEFFLGWIHEPVTPVTRRDRWSNAGSLLNAAFARANLERHHVLDTDQKVEKAVAAFLKLVDEKLAKEFEYFQKTMINLPNSPTAKEFETLLTEYLKRFFSLTQP